MDVGVGSSERTLSGRACVGEGREEPMVKKTRGKIRIM